MGKFLFRFFLLILFSVISIAIFLSVIGLETDKFDGLIKEKANEVNKYVKLEFNNTKIHLNPKELNLVIKLQNPKVLLKKKEFKLSKIDLFLPLKSFITSDFLLQRTEIAFTKNNIKDLSKITNIFLPRILNKQINRILIKGNLEGEFIVPFNQDGSLGSNSKFTVKLLDADLNITKDFQIKNLSTEMKYFPEYSDGKEINFVINQGSILNLNLEKSTIDIKFINNKKIIKSKIKTSGSSKYIEIKKISSLLGLNLKNIKHIDLTSDLETSFNFSIDNKFKITDKFISTSGKIKNLELEHKKIKNIEKFIPSYDSKIILKDADINFNQAGELKLSGLLKFNKEFEDFLLHFSGNSKKFNMVGKINLSDQVVRISKLNYLKKENVNAIIDFNLLKDTKLGYNIKNLLYSENKTKIKLDKVKLNNKFELENLDEIIIKTFSKNIKNNDFSISRNNKKKNSISITGDVFDSEPLLKSLYKTSDKKTLSNSFNNNIKVNFDNVLTGTNDDVFNFSMIASIDKGAYVKLSLKGNFSEKEIVEMSIYQIDKDKKTLEVVSDRARPFIKNFDFIKGFEGGKMEYVSIISKEFSESNLIINNFKVSKVPALAQLLTLASLQGIADTLSGEGIRFDSFEMKSNTQGNLMNIDDALAMGPAVSILLSGYVDKGKIVSLRGTLVPATKLNSIIASIPVVGEILVGKKTGEGVVGVSFKMKGPPKDIRTTVNPVKTLTPRFIVRAVEKMKRKKKEETTK